MLEALGVNLNLTPEQVAQSIDEIGIGFMFAPNYHSAMKYAAPVRRELGVRTLFNVLGPLTNPAGAKNQVMGVFRHGSVPASRLAECCNASAAAMSWWCMAATAWTKSRGAAQPMSPN